MKIEQEKVIIVTGGSRGIGEEIVRELAREKYNIVLNYNKTEKNAEKIQQELEEQGRDISIYKADVTKREEVRKLINYTIEKYGRIDVLINNAGISQTKVFNDITDKDWNNMLQTNLTSAFYGCQEVIPIMLKQKSGCIINISSIWGQTGGACEVHYSVAKAGLDGMTKSLAKELGPSQIRVNSIAPGIIQTQMNENYTDQELEDIKEEIPLERIGTTLDIAKAVKWLINDNYTTGQIIGVNGGWLI